MHKIIEQQEKKGLKTEISEFRAGDTVSVSVRIKEGDKERIQIFKGVVIKKKRGLTNASFTVRKVSYGIGVERIFPLHSPHIEKIQVITYGRVRRSKLYYLRDLKGKAARLKERRFV
ncbi:MAG: 50S ribosomal protein L19 [Pseudomonadota bacterium]